MTRTIPAALALLAALAAPAAADWRNDPKDPRYCAAMLRAQYDNAQLQLVLKGQQQESELETERQRLSRMGQGTEHLNLQRRLNNDRLNMESEILRAEYQAASDRCW